MKRNLIASFIMTTIAVSMVATVCGDKASLSQLSLLDLEGKSVNPLADSGAKAVVFIFTRADCPISNRYAPDVRRLSASFASEKVKFWLVYPDADAPPDAIRRHIKEYDYNCEALRDPRRELVKATGVSVTPEAAVFVFNHSGARMIYRGRIDDQYAAFGKHRPAPTVRDLEDVLTTVVKGKAVKFKTSPAVGCYISQQITFNKHIAPIIFANCAACHHAGGAGPFSLLEYQEVKKRARQIVTVTGSRYMPPWLPEPGYGEFADARRLSDEQIKTISQWVEQGMIEGDRTDLPPAPKFNESWQLGQPDLIIKMPQPYTLPAGTADVFRNFVIPLPITKTRYVKAVEFLPGDKKIFHHANILIDRTGGSRRRDEQDPEVGFGGMDVAIESESFDPDSHFLFWKPGSALWIEPDGMAWPASSGTDLVLNLHMQPSGKPETIQPQIGLYFTDRAPEKFPMLLQLEHDGAIDIPPGRKDFVITDELTLPVDVDALAIYPHAHYIGKDLRGWAALPDGTKKPLVWIKDWDLNWQAVYRYERPIFLPAGTVVSMRFTYDNSAANPRNPNRPPKRVVVGDKATDEMGHLWLQVLPRSREDARIVLQEALMRQRLKKYQSDFTAHFNLGAVLETAGKLEEAISHYQAALRAKPDAVTAHNNLGAAFQTMGNKEAAIDHYRQAVKLKPDYINARCNLGNALLSGGKVDEAIIHLREALRLRPDDASARNSLGSALATQGKLNEAVSEFAESLRLDPDNADVHVNLAYALTLQEKIDEAITHYEQALRLKPDNAPENAETLNELGVLYGRKRKLTEALDKFERAVRVNPDHAGARENLKRARAAMEKMKERKP